MNNFSIESLAFELALEFRKHYKKHTYKVYRIDNIKSSKWWPHFITTAEKYINYPDFDLRFFISIQFEKYGKVMPFFLTSKKAEEAYKQNYFKENNEEDKIFSEVKGSIDAIKLWASKNKKNFSDYFILDSNKWMLRNRIEYLSPYFLAFSKSFLSTYKNLDEEFKKTIVSKESLNIKRAYVKQFPEAKKRIKMIMKEDFI